MAIALRILWAVFFVWLFASCVDDEVEAIILTPFEELEWPQVQAVPDCVPWKEGQFALPILQAASGDLQLRPSATLIPTLTIERLEVRVLTPGQNLDTAAAGQLRVLTTPGIEIVSEGIVVDGYGEVSLRFLNEGVHQVELSLENDVRLGSVEIEAYTTQLPIWEFEIVPEEFEEILANPGERITKPGQLVVDGVTHQTTVRVHGGASRDFPKKSLRFNLKESALASGEDKLIVRAEYNDKSMLRTWLGYQYFRNGTMVPTPNTMFVHLRVNQRYYGLMQQVERIDKNFLKTHGLDKDGNLYEADPPIELSVPGGNLLPLSSDEAYYRTYQWHNGIGAWEDLIEFIEFTLQIPDNLFPLVVAAEVNLDSYLSYLAMMALLQNHDHIRKNYYIYRDPSGDDGRWMALPWDLDLTMGHLWSEVDDVLDQRIIVDADLFVGEYNPERFGYFNQLTDRVLARPLLRQRFLENVAYMMEHVVTDEFLSSRLSYAKCLLAPDLLADKNKWADNDEYLDRVQEITDFWTGRVAYIETVLKSNGIEIAP